jgi:hypothetical protein
VTSKKLGALLRSVPPATVRTEASEATSATPPPPSAATPQHQTAPEGIEPEVPLQVLIPRRIRTQLGVQAAQERRSLRELILRAIRNLGIEVSDEEIRGKRGRKSA